MPGLMPGIHVLHGFIQSDADGRDMTSVRGHSRHPFGNMADTRLLPLECWADRGCVLDKLKALKPNLELPCHSLTASPICNPIFRPGAGISINTPNCCTTCIAPQHSWRSACGNSAATKSRQA